MLNKADLADRSQTKVTCSFPFLFLNLLSKNTTFFMVFELWFGESFRFVVSANYVLDLGFDTVYV